MKLLEKGEVLVQTVLQGMDKSQPDTVRILAFKLAQHLMDSEEGCLKMSNLKCEPMVKSIVSAMSDLGMHLGEVPNQAVSLIMEACRLALITRWPGMHHAYLWKFRIDTVLLDLLMYGSWNMHQHQQSLSVNEPITVAREGLNADFLLELSPYVWEIIGWLLAQCEEDFSPGRHFNELHVSILIATACLAFVDSISSKRLLCQADRTYTYRSVSAAKATLMMLYSPCKYIASRARSILFEVLQVDGLEHLKHLICALNFVYSVDNSRMPDECQMLINLTGLACYVGLPDFHRHAVRNGGLKALLAFIRCWLDNDIHIGKLSLTSHLQTTANKRTCCRTDMVEWEGREIHLLLALWTLAELLNHHESEGLELDIFSGQTSYNKEHLIKDIEDICIKTTSSGVRWYCSYLLSFFGFYGFPSELGKGIGSASREEDHSNMCLVLRDGKSLSVHRVLLLVRCPSLLPPEDPSIEERSPDSGSSSARQVIDNFGKTKKKVTLSAQVDQQAHVKLLDFIYSGYMQAEADLVRKLKTLAKHCNLQPLLQLLCKERPKWAASLCSFDLTQALGPSANDFSDIILEANSTEDTVWACSCCSISVPHFHSHRIILWSSCEYMRALFQSGMQESRSQSLKVPVSWEALQKLLIWVYSNNIPEPPFGCLWDNMDVEKKMSELKPYIELCWLAEFWFLDDVNDECTIIVTSSMGSSPELSVKVIQVAANFSQWSLVNFAANIIAPVYQNLQRAGALDFLDVGVVEMIRLASVRLFQE